MEFEWDPHKADRNLRKHKVSFEEAATVFGDPLSMTVPDPDHSWEEDRYLTVGMSDYGRLLIVAHTEEAGGERIRIISARPLTRREREAYEQGEFDRG
ncbi:MAG: BrnT family toxin [Chloroflexi bacterium]|nr:MAG: BrnT family toxin [Chloroflexota bacterium]